MTALTREWVVIGGGLLYRERTDATVISVSGFLHVHIQSISTPYSNHFYFPTDPLNEKPHTQNGIAEGIADA